MGTDFDQPQGVSGQRCVAYTADACVTGFLTTAHARFSDAFNALSNPLLRLQDATVQTQEADSAEVCSVPGAVVRVDDVVFCYPEDIEEDALRSDPMQRRERTQAGVVMLADGRTISGVAHLPPNVGLLDYLLSRSERFLPMTAATIARGGHGLMMPFVLVGLRHVSAMYETLGATVARSYALPPLATLKPTLPQVSEPVGETREPGILHPQPVTLGLLGSHRDGPVASPVAPEPDRSRDLFDTGEMSSTTELRHNLLSLTSRTGGNGALTRWIERRQGLDRRQSDEGPPDGVERRSGFDRRLAASG